MDKVALLAHLGSSNFTQCFALEMRRSEILEWCVFLKNDFKLEQCILCLSPLPRLARLLWCGASRSWEFEKSLPFCIFMFIVLTESSRRVPCVCICLYLKYVLYIILLSVVYPYFGRCVACLFSPVPVDAIFLLQHWLPSDDPCKHVMRDFFTSLPLPLSPDLFQWLTVGLPLLAIKLCQVHRCNGCSVCESRVHISLFGGLRTNRHFAAIGNEFCWSGRESAL